MKIKIIQIIGGSQAGTIHQGSTYIIPVVPPQDNSDGHRISGPLRYFALIRLYALVLARIIAHPSQGTLRTAISAFLVQLGFGLARLLSGRLALLEWVGRIPMRVIIRKVPPFSRALPHGSCTDEAKDRHFAVFRHCPYDQQ